MPWARYYKNMILLHKLVQLSQNLVLFPFQFEEFVQLFIIRSPSQIKSVMCSDIQTVYNCLAKSDYKSKRDKSGIANHVQTYSHFQPSVSLAHYLASTQKVLCHSLSLVSIKDIGSTQPKFYSVPFPIQGVFPGFYNRLKVLGYIQS